MLYFFFYSYLENKSVQGHCNWLVGILLVGNAEFVKLFSCELLTVVGSLKGWLMDRTRFSTEMPSQTIF